MPQAVGRAAAATTVPRVDQRPKTDGQKVRLSKRLALGVASLVVEQARPLAGVSLGPHALGAMQSKLRLPNADPTQCEERPLVRFPTKRPMPNDVRQMTRALRKMMR